MAQIVVSYKATVRGYVRYTAKGGGMAVFSANLFGKGVEPPATIVLDGPFVPNAGDAEALAKAEKAAEKARVAAEKALARLEKATAKAEALATTVPENA